MQTRKTKVDRKVAAKSLSAEVTPTYDALVSAIESLVRDARTGLKAALNTIMLQTYWRTGEYIVEYEQNGCDKAVYGVGLMRRLAHDLTLKLGRGFAHSNLNYMRKFYLVSQKIQTSGFFGKGQTSGFLTWSHYLEILRADDPPTPRLRQTSTIEAIKRRAAEKKAAEEKKKAEARARAANRGCDRMR